MANLVLPTPNVALGKCPHCGAEIKISEPWYSALLKILKTVNTGL